MRPSAFVPVLLVPGMLAVSPAPLGAQAAFVRGDFNQDGGIDVSDPVAVIIHLFIEGSRPSCPSAGDFSDDGTVDVTDAVSLLGYLFLLGDPPAAPFPGCGGDPTPDPLGCTEHAPCSEEDVAPEITEWVVPWSATRPRDPYVDGLGRVWFVGQTGDYIAFLEPPSGEFTRFEAPSGAAPHNLIVGASVWYAGNGDAHIGRLDPESGEITRFPMPDPAAADPHTLAFDGNGPASRQFSGTRGRPSRLIFKAMRPRVPNETEGRIDRALRGDPKALEDLVRAEAPRLHGIAWRITGDTALAEDVVQEVFLRILEGRSPVRRSGAAGAWLARVAAHAAIDLVRRRGARERREEAHAMAGAERREEAHDPVADEEVRALVAEGFGALPIDVRAAIWLNVVEGDPLRTVAKALGTPLTTLYRRVEDGLGSLKKHLERRGATAVLALPMADLLRRMGEPEIPAGLAAKVLEQIAGGRGGGGAAAGGAAKEVIEKGAVIMAATGGKKVVLGVIIALLLLLGAGTFVADPFQLFGGRRGGGGPPERTVLPAPPPAERAAKAPGPPAAAVEEAQEANRPAPAAPYGSAVVRVIWGDDKTPAAGVHMYVVPWGDPLPFLHEETAVTDGEGEARIARVHEGGVTVYLDRGGNGAIEVKAGRESEVTIEVPPGIDVEGVVVDGGGKPVPAASIWLSDHGSRFKGLTIDTAGPDGKFQIRSMRKERYLGARASGFAPSPLQEILAHTGSVHSVRLVLEKRGVAVDGVVLDPAERPLAGAMLRVVEAKAAGRRLDDGTELLPPPPILARTGGEGRFAFEDVPIGDLTLSVRAEDLVPLEAPLSVPEEGLTDLKVVLEEGVILAGTVRTAGGKPAPGAVVRVGFYEDFMGLGTRTGADGSFHLRGVRPGEFEAHADGDGRGKASARFTAEAGEEVRWDAELSTGLEIHGRVVDEDGKPLSQVLVGAEGKGCPHAFIWTDREGRFRFANCKDVAHRLTAGSSGDNVGLPGAWKDGVMPGKGEVVLLYPAAARPTAFLMGSIRDPEGKPGGKAQIDVLMDRLGSGERKLPEEDGTFRIGPLPSGHYRVVVRLAAFPAHTIQHDLSTGETADLGTIQVSRGGRLEARLRRPDGSPSRSMPIRVLSAAADVDLPMTLSPDGVAVSEPCQPGEYNILVWNDRIASAWIPVKVEDGATASVEVVLHEGARRAFRLSTPEGRLEEPIRLTVRDGDGKTVFDWRVPADSSGWKPSPDGAGRALELGAGFAPGSYTAEASGSGLRGQAAFSVTGLDEGAAPIAIDLR